MLLRGVRLVDLGEPDSARPGSTEPVDLRIEDDQVTAIAPQLAVEPGEHVLAADGRWLSPGVWDAHVHLGQWARRNTRLDVSTADRDQALRRVREGLASAAPLLVGVGYRPATWPEPPTVAALDAVTGSHPVALISGDAHAGWLNSAALARFGMERRDEPVREAEWFALVPAVLAVEDAQVGVGAYTAALRDAAALGVVGIVDYEFEPGFERWATRYPAAGVGLRVRTSTYPSDLDAALAAGLRTGSTLGDPRLTMGALKIISDGSLNTRTAHCCQPYAGGGHGVQNVPGDQLVELLGRAHAHGLEVSLHAIGDAAIQAALDAFATTGAHGRIEHAQLLASGQAQRMAELGLSASVQPAHLLDDRRVTAQVWDEARAARSFALRELLDSGVRLELGSDAPVAPLDPWLAIAAAVHRGEPEEPGWYPAHAITPRDALAASTGGRGTVTVGSLADLALLDDDPLVVGEASEAAHRLRNIRAALTLVGGIAVHDELS